MGVEMRVHVFFPLLVIVFMGISGAQQWPRGIVLFMLLVAAIVTRETARLVVAAVLDFRLRAVLLLPIGGLFAYANPESQENANRGSGQVALALAGPVANLASALVVAAIIQGSSGAVSLMRYPLLTSTSLLRSVVWMQAMLGALHLLPAYPLDCGRIIRSVFARTHGYGPAGRAAAGIGQGIAFLLMLSYMPLRDPWLFLAGLFIMVGAQIEDQGVFFQSVVDTVRMREVMLTDFATL
jgi:Zn-dependent protease